MYAPKTLGITFLIKLNAPLTSAFNNLLSPILYNPQSLFFFLEIPVLTHNILVIYLSKELDYDKPVFFGNYYRKIVV